MTANAIISFDFEQQAVRTIERDGEPWFVLVDVCRVLGIGNPSKVALKLAADEKGITNSNTLGGAQETIIVNEGGLYTIILRSQGALIEGSVAYRFRRWVTGEVLPAIRRTGRYDMTGRRAAAQMELSDRTARRRELPRLMDRLERETNAEKRRVIHALIVKACVSEDIVPPAIDLIGRDAPTPPDILLPFWTGIGVLRAQGKLINHSHSADTLAISLVEVRKAFAVAKINVPIDTALRSALRLSQSPVFIANKAVNSRVERKSVQCWVFRDGGALTA